MGLGKVPLYFGAADRPLFGFYHPPAAARSRDTGVLLCNPLGDDLIRAHRTFRHLAETLAASGFPVLRFDFDGTGDSAGDERDPHRAAAWRADIGYAASELRACAGVDRLAFVGLKLGATFAALGAEALGGIEALVLWGAFDNGASFVSETTKSHKMHVMLEPSSFSGGPPSPDGQEGLGFLLTHRTIAELGDVDLLSMKRAPARKTLVLDTANIEVESPLVKHLKALGGAVSYRHLPGNKFLIMSPDKSEIPGPAISAISGWLAEECPTIAEGPLPSVSGPPRVTSAPALRERAVFFGADRRLFGILTAPPARPRSDLPAIVLLNAGTVHRVGPHRLYVSLARQWAALGFDVLRVDLSGIGDSPMPLGGTENLTYPRNGLDDVRAAMDCLTEVTQARRFVVAGLCSGGDLAFQLGFKEPRVASAIMINPRTFCVNELTMVDSYEQVRWYQQAVTQTDSWTDLLRSDGNIARALRLAAPKVKDLFVQRAKQAVTNLLGVVRPNDADQRRETNVPHCLRVMAGRGVDAYLLVTEHDPGVDYVDANHRQAMRALSSLAGFSRTDVKGTDHSFTARWAQEKVAALLSDHLTQRFLAARAA